MFHKIHHPILVQGSLQKKSYFEGWYFKQVSTAHGRTVSIIPGFSTNPKDPHSFIQVIATRPLKTHYMRFPLASFHWTDAPFSLEVGGSRFDERGIDLNLAGDGLQLSGALRFGPFSEIQKSRLSPNVMGFFAYIPGMECNHGILSMDHTVNGHLEYNGESILFLEDRGYMEKDWGTSFPSDYIWIQANHFPQRGDSLFLSVANIPMLASSFQGFIANLIHKGIEYRFATYNNAKIESLQSRKADVDLIFSHRNHKLLIHAEADESAPLKAPRRGQMANTIKEGLDGKVCLHLLDGKETVCKMESPFAGIEIVNL